MCMLYPQDKIAFIWDIFINLLLVVTCIATPVRIAFESIEPSLTAVTTDVLVDTMFFFDMVIIFNRAYFDEKVFKLVSDRT